MSTATIATTPISLRIDLSTKERLSRIASRLKRSSHSVALEALDSFIKSQEDQEKWNRHCDASLQKYLETGLHATEDEVNRWMDSWGTADVLPPPKCHV